MPSVQRFIVCHRGTVEWTSDEKAARVRCRRPGILRLSTRGDHTTFLTKCCAHYEVADLCVIPFSS